MLVFLLAALVLAALLFACDHVMVTDWVGGYPVEVRVERTGTRPVKAAAVALLFKGERLAVENDFSRIDSPWQPVSLTEGGTFTVEVKCGGRDSGLGRRLSFVRNEVLVLKVEYADGTTKYVVAELPESRGPRQLSVQVP